MARERHKRKRLVPDGVDDVAEAKERTTSGVPRSEEAEVETSTTCSFGQECFFEQHPHPYRSVHQGSSPRHATNTTFFSTPASTFISDPSSLTIGGVPLTQANLCLPLSLNTTERIRRTTNLALELHHQQTHPPVLPPSQVPPLPPKPTVGEFVKFPDGIIGAVERREIEDRNNAIAAELQRVDRERNNMAAKKSRQARLEALGNTRALLNEKAAECAWYRMRVVTLGGERGEWDALEDDVRASMIREVERLVGEVDGVVAEVRKKDEAKRRTERNKCRKLRKGVVARGGDDECADTDDTMDAGGSIVKKEEESA